MSRWISSSTLCALLGLGLCLGTPQAKADLNVSLNTSPGLPSAGTADPGYTAAFYTDDTINGSMITPIGLGTAPAPTASGIPGGTTAFTPVVVGPNGSFPVGTNWNPNTASSSWIGPNRHGAAGEVGTPDDSGLPNPINGFLRVNSAPQGYFYYDKEFTLTSLGHLVGGLWATDNNGISIFLNGHDEGQVTPFEGFISFNAFTVNSADFVVGTNHIDFVVFNENFDPVHSSPTGLRVEGAVVPEPSTMAVAVLGAIGFLGYGLRRKAKGV